MSLSKVFKESAVFINHEPFMLGLVEVNDIPEPEILDEENIGGRPEEIERAAYERGFHAGEKAGFEFGRQKAEVLFNGLGTVLHELSSFKDTLFKSCEREMLELSLAVAKKVIQREVEAKEDGVLECVRHAMRAVAGGGEITVKLNPKEIEVVKQHKSELARFHGNVKGLNMEADESIAKGGCVVSSNYGEVDATIGSILQEIEEKLNDAY